ncbi:MAG: isopenicillin N synthase-like dioxygenase [Gammaproteobacteria bacterium]|jgi:isopenicillin N synthase-like dioxygenase
MASPTSLPCLDLESRPQSVVARQRIACALDSALQDTGFCYLSAAGVSEASIGAVFDASRAFHALPPHAKSALSINEFHRGYIAPKSSVIRSSSVATVTHPNLSDSLMVMHEVAPDHRDFGRTLNGPNQWPGLAHFRPIVEEYMRQMRALSQYLTSLIALALGLEPHHFDSAFETPTVWLRLLRYDPLPLDGNADAFSAAPHTDYGFITVLAQDEHGGLEVRDSAGQWRAAPPVPGTFILNVADMLERWTDGRWPSSAHRVRNTGASERFSVPYFYDPHIDVQVERLPGLEARTSRPAVIFGNYVSERLDRNYAYRHRAHDGATTPVPTGTHKAL